MTRGTITPPFRGSTGTVQPDVVVDATTSGDFQYVKLADPTEDSTAAIGVADNPMVTSSAAVGATTDAKVQSDVSGSLIGFLRGIVSWMAGLIGTVQQTPSQTTALRVQIGPGDIISSIPVVSDFPHHQVHEGEALIHSDLQTGGLASGSNYDVRISVGALTATTRTPHLLIELIADAMAEVTLHEGVTWTSGGTAASGLNRNRNVADDTGTLYVNGGTALTVNSVGTTIWTGMTTGAKSSAGGTDRGTYEMVLKTSTEYMVRVTSRTAGLKFLLRLEYYKDLGV